MLTLIFLITLLFVPLFTSANINNVSFRNISKREGLKDLTVSALFKDSKGYMWIGTATSVEQYDGKVMKHYSFPGDDNKLKWVNDIKESPWGTILIGNENGLWEKSGDELKPLHTDSIKGIVRKIIPYSNGDVCVSSSEGIWICTQDRIIRHIILDNTSVFGDNEVISFCCSDDYIWVITSTTLYSVSKQDFIVRKYYDNSFDRHDLYSYREVVLLGDMLYIATLGNGIHTYDIKNNRFGRFIDVGCNVINDLVSDGKDILHIATDGNGIVFASISANKVIDVFRNNINSSGSLHSNSTYSVLLDRDGLLWVGLHQLGLDLSAYDTGIFALYDLDSKFTTKNIPIRAISIEENEKVICSRNGLYYINENNDEVTHVHTPEIRSNTVLCCKKIEGFYYFGTYGGGMYVLNPDDNSVSDFSWERSEDFVSNSVFDINVDSEMKVWISSSSGLYCYKDKKLLFHFTEKNSKIKSSVVYTIFFDSTGKGWICTDKGMLLWEPTSEKLMLDVFPEGFVDRSKIKSIYEDSEQKLYFIIDKESLFVSDLNLKDFGYIDNESVISGKELSFVIEDDDKFLWFGTDDGLYRYDKKHSFRSYGLYEGIPNQIFLSCKPVKDSDGNLWFGNSMGLLCLNKDKSKRHRNKPYRLRINKILRENTDITQTVGLKENESGYSFNISAINGNLKISLSDLAYVGLDQMYYEYRTDDEDWKIIKGSPSIILENLYPGTRKVEIRRLSMPSTSVIMTLTIGIPKYVYCIVGVILVVVTSFIIYKRRNRLKNVSTENNIEEIPLKADNVIEKKEIVKSESHKYVHLSEEECQSICEKLDDVMARERLFTNPELKLNDLALAAGVSIYNLSYILNHHLNSNFYDYANNFRIKEFEKLIESGAQSKYTMNALIEMCGFSSRSSFFRYFKKITGMPPGEYIKKHFNEEIQ